MELALRYTSFRARLRNYLSDKETLLEYFRMMRYALLQGPWQPWVVRYYRGQHANPPLAVYPHTLFPALDVDRAVEQLERDAYAPAFMVPDDLVDGAIAYGKRLGVKRSDDPHLYCEAAHRIARDPQIVEVARRYLGAEPILNSSKLYWTIPPPDAKGQMDAAAERGRFHYDLADVRSLAVFIYLSDVDEECGPHIVIPGTQGRKTLGGTVNRFLSERDALRRFGDRIRVVTGRRGTGWFEDIACYHKQAPARKARLMMSIIYSLHRPPLDDVARRPIGVSEVRMGV
jgi:hypothetical protein